MENAILIFHLWYIITHDALVDQGKIFPVQVAFQDLAENFLF